jgi:5-methyltetrahydropteroyltriglutamate--homocysteine methyltransferase
VLVEHPELVADAIIAFAELVGRKHDAGTGCGLGGRVDPQIAKLRASVTARRSRARSCGVEFKSACAG